MSPREFEARVRDMLLEIAAIETVTAGITYAEFCEDVRSFRAVSYSLAVIGEAVASSIRLLEQREPSIPWSQIRGLRNVVIHEYFRLELETIWQTVLLDLPLLKAALLRLLAKGES